MNQGNQFYFDSQQPQQNHSPQGPAPEGGSFSMLNNHQGNGAQRPLSPYAGAYQANNGKPVGRNPRRGGSPGFNPLRQKNHNSSDSPSAQNQPKVNNQKDYGNASRQNRPPAPEGGGAPAPYGRQGYPPYSPPLNGNNNKGNGGGNEPPEVRNYSPYPPYNGKPSGRKPKKKKSKKFIFILLLALVLAGVGGYGVRHLSVSSQVAPYQKVFYPNVSVNGIDLSGKTWEEATTLVYENAQSFYKNFHLALTFQGMDDLAPFSTNITGSDLNITIQEDQLKEKLQEAWAIGREGDIYQQKATLDYARNNVNAFSTASISKDTSYIEEILSNLQLAINRAPVDATVAFTPNMPEPFTYTSELVGRNIDPLPLKEEIIHRIEGMESGQIALESYITVSHPGVTVSQLQADRQLRGSYQTPIHMATVTEELKLNAQNRLVNIGISSQAASVEIPAGKTFSFNDIVGKRTREKGYLDAIEYVYGAPTYDAGGGVCQTSSTLYMAALRAGMQITKRDFHRGEIGYMSKGMDATVYWKYDDHKVDFAFKNTSDRSIYIVAKVLDSSITDNKRDRTLKIDIYGASMNGLAYDLRVDYEEVIPNPPLEVKRVKNKNMYEDEMEVYKEGKDGLNVIRTLITYEYNKDTNSYIEIGHDALSTDKHPAKAPTIEYGTKKRPAEGW